MSIPAPKVFSIGAINWKSMTALSVFLAAILVSIYLDLDQQLRIAVILVATLAFFLILFLLKAARIVVTEDMLIVGAGLYKLKIPMEKIDASRSALLEPGDPFKLRWRTNGLGWPGLSLGWFRSNTRKSIFAAMSGRSNRVYIHTSDRFDIVVTPQEPEEFLEALKRH